jgi:hypothetical protein
MQAGPGQSPSLPEAAAERLQQVAANEVRRRAWIHRVTFGFRGG